MGPVKLFPHGTLRTHMCLSHASKRTGIRATDFRKRKNERKYERMQQVRQFGKTRIQQMPTVWGIRL